MRFTRKESTEVAGMIAKMLAALEFYADEKQYEPGRYVVNGLTRPVLQDGGKTARSALNAARGQSVKVRE